MGANRLHPLRERIWQFLLCLLLGLVLGGLAVQGLRLWETQPPYREVNAIEGVWLELQPKTLTPGGAEGVIRNMTEREDLDTGPGFCVERRIGRRWYAHPNKLYPGHALSPEMGPLLAIPILSASQITAKVLEGGKPGTELSFSWEWAYGELPPGEYRVVIRVSSALDIPLTSDSPEYYLTAEFTI